MLTIELDHNPKLIYFCQKHITPRFEFGFGLSYTKFQYSQLQVSQVSSPDNTDAESQAAWDAGQASTYGQGSSAAIWFVELELASLSCILIGMDRLHRPAYQVTFNVKNVGSVNGTEVTPRYSLWKHTFGDSSPLQIPQLYVNMDPSSGEPPSLLKGFNDVELAAGETKQVTIRLSRYDLSIWDVYAQGWRRPHGKIGLSVGASSRDIRLRGAIPY